MSDSSPDFHPLVYYAGTGNGAANYLAMRFVENDGNQELADALQLQGQLLGNLELDRLRMVAQYELLDRELTRRAQQEVATTTARVSAAVRTGGGGAAGGTGAADAANDREREQAKIRVIDDEDDRELSPNGLHGRESLGNDRNSGGRARSHDWRPSSTNRELASRSPRGPATRSKIGKGNQVSSWRRLGASVWQ